MTPDTIRRVLMGGSMLVVIFAAIALRPEREELLRAINESGSWAPLLFWVIGIVLMSTCVPKTVISLLAGSIFGPWIGTALLLLIATTAAGLNFKIGSWWWNGETDPSNNETDDRGVILIQQTDRAPGDHRWIYQVAKEAGFGMHLLMRLSPVPTMLISYGCGAAGSRWKPYMAAAIVAVIPQSLWVIAGSTAAEAAINPSHVEGPAKWISVAIAVLAAAIGAVIIPAQFVRKMKKSRLADSTAESCQPSEA